MKLLKYKNYQQYKFSLISTLSAYFSLYLIVKPQWKNCEFFYVGEDEDFWAIIVLQGSLSSTIGNRADPWFVKPGSDLGIHGFIDHLNLNKHGEFYMISLKKNYIIFRVINLPNIMKYVYTVLQRYNYIDWVKKKKYSNYNLVIPIPTYIAVTPYRFDDATYHDLIEDFNNTFSLYGNSSYTYRTMSIGISSETINKFFAYTNNFGCNIKGFVKMIDPVLMPKVKCPIIQNKLLRFHPAY